MQNTNLVPLVVADIAIRQDSHGRYCLNDLHKAAGEEQRHQPRYWLSNKQTTELVDELGDSGKALSVVRGGPGQGTYVVKQLVYAYAMWISPAFSLKVIRAYDAIVRGDFSSEYLPAILQEIDQRLSARLVDLEAAIETLIHGELAKHNLSVRYGCTSGQIWRKHGLPSEGMRGAANWLGNRPFSN